MLNCKPCFYFWLLQLRDLMALPDAAVRESCSRSLERLCSILHEHANSNWQEGEIAMTNAENISVLIPSYLWPAWKLAECGQTFGDLVNVYLLIEEVS